MPGSRINVTTSQQIDFADVPALFDSPMVIELDARAAYSEECWIGSGFLCNQVAVVVTIERQHDVIRIIAAR